MYTRYFIKAISWMFPNIPGLLFLTFVVCDVLASLSIVTGVAVSVNVVLVAVSVNVVLAAVSVNVVKPDSGK